MFPISLQSYNSYYRCYNYKHVQLEANTVHISIHRCSSHNNVYVIYMTSSKIYEHNNKAHEMGEKYINIQSQSPFLLFYQAGTGKLMNKLNNGSCSDILTIDDTVSTKPSQRDQIKSIQGAERILLLAADMSQIQKEL